MLTISQLKTKWEKEKNSYIKKEIGDGVQKFVKDVLKSSEIFNLKEGLNSTPLERRKYEFKEEEAKKAARHADVVIFVNPDIIIPMEIEKYQNIEAGEKQIIQYQLDWNEQSNRRYGILTDGYTWRFYNNNEYWTFTLNEIWGQLELFLEFWNEYIKPDFYYLSFFEKKGQLPLFKEIEVLNVELDRQIFFEDITKLIRSFKNKLQIEGYLKDLDKKEREKTAVEITYAYIIQFILYKTLVDNEFGKFKQEFSDIEEGIYNCLKANQVGKILGIIKGISDKISQNIYRPFAKEQEFITNQLLELFSKPKNELHEVSPWLDIFIFIKKYNFAYVRNEIFGYIYENYLKELYEDTKKGQYFTDPAIVNFMLKQVGYDSENIEKRLKNKPEGNYISVIDPSCGSGTFLYSAVDKIIESVSNGSEDSSKKIEELINNNIFGLDIAEFPLYLAEMNILMRMLPLITNEKYNNPIDKKIKVFKTNDSTAEFMDTALRNTINDINVEYEKNKNQLSLFTQKLNLGYSSYVRDEDDLMEMKKSLEVQPKCPRRRFDFVIGNPPYISYNECSKQKILIFDLIKKGQVKLNNIYGVNLHSTPNDPKKYRPNPNLYAFFIALGISLLKDNGKICYIIPQTILTAGDLDVIRYHLAKFTTIEKIITFSCKMFIGRGLRQNKPIPTSSLIFVINRKIPVNLHQIEIINYKSLDSDIENCVQNILNNKKISKKKVLQIKLLQNTKSWNFIKQEKIFLDFHKVYKRNTDNISIYYNHTLAESEFNSRFYFDSGYSIDEKQLLNIVPKEDYYVYPKIKNCFWTVKEIRGFWPNIRRGKSQQVIKLRQANQGYNLLDCKYKVIWSYVNPDRFHFTSIPVIWARNQICAIGSNNREELLYIFSLLNSPVIKTILYSNLKSENEKDFLISTTSIKEFVYVPIISESNQFIKDEIIKMTDRVISLEEVKLLDLVDFSKVMMQKFNWVEVKDDSLILVKDGNKTKCNIKKDSKLVGKAIEEKFPNNDIIKDKEITLSDLKSLPVIDFDKQKEIKDYIDDLVFILYFNLQIKKVGFDQAEVIKEICSKNKFYNIIKNYIQK